MAFSTVGVGSAANDGTGDPLRTAFQTVNTAITAANSGQFQGFKNRIINGGFDIWQRGTSFSGNTGQRFVADRFYTASASGLTSVVASRQTGNQARYCLRFGREDSTSGLGFTWATQNLEWANIIGLLGQQCMISFRARKGSGLSGTASVSVRQTSAENPGMSSGGGFATGDTVLLSQNLSLTTSWQTFSYQFTPTTAAKTLAVVFGWTPTGTATNDYIEIELLQIEPGAVATAFEHRSVGAELLLCQRYFERISAADQSRHTIAIGAAYSSTMIFGSLRYARKRINPTITAAGTIGFFANNTLINASATAFNYASVDGAEIQLTVAGAIQGHAGHVRWNNDGAGYIDISAEL